MQGTRPRAAAVDADLPAAVAQAEAQFVGSNPQSRALHAKAREVMPGGNTRTALHLARRRCDMQVSDEELARRAEPRPDLVPCQTPWQEIHRRTVGQLGEGAVIEEAASRTTSRATTIEDSAARPIKLDDCPGSWHSGEGREA